MIDTTVPMGELTVNEVIRKWPATIEPFNRHGIDACCGGAVTVKEAAERDGADAAVLIAELERAARRVP
jgi:iron-sulfur cluster repair protein YtfE (RIC family)